MNELSQRQGLLITYKSHVVTKTKDIESTSPVERVRDKPWMSAATRENVSSDMCV